MTTWLDRLPQCDPNMEKHAFVTNITPLPPGVTREVALAFLHDHIEMIELNPLVIRHQPTTPPPNATLEEQVNCKWYEITDVISYLPGGLAKSEVSYKGGFYDIPKGLQTHVFAPAGVDLKARWTVGGNMPGEPPEPVELGVDIPKEGLYLREDTELRCNVFLMNFVKRNLRKSHDVLVDDLIKKAHDPKYQPTTGYKAAKPSKSLSNNTKEMDVLSAASSYLTPQSAKDTSGQATPQQEDLPCSCPNGVHEVMCHNYRYIPQNKPGTTSEGRRSFQAPTNEQTVSGASSHRATASGDSSTSSSRQQYTAYKPPSTAQKRLSPPADFNKPLPPGPPGSDHTMKSVTPQLYGEQAELPVSIAETHIPPDPQARGTSQSPAELDDTDMAYWEQQRNNMF
jgi:hypothetical protein